MSCIYHGWRFGSDGGCQHIPAHPNVTPPKSINCGPLPVCERDGVVYVAAKQPADDAVAFGGYLALRSLVIAAPLQNVEQAVQGEPKGRGLATELAGHPAVLLLEALGPQEVLLIVLVPQSLEAQGKLAISAAAEALRRAAEDQKAIAS